MKTVTLSTLALGLITFVVAAPSCSITDAADVTLVENPKLPDPFKFEDGTEVTDKASWDCRRQEIKELFQAFELGTLPPKPHRLGTRFYAKNNVLALNATESSKSISWNVTINYPKNGTAPYPLLIALGGISIPVPAGVATITYNNNEIAAQDSPASRGVGKFYDLYGKNATASAMMAWTWGISRIIDALEDTPRANIDTTKIAVSGCSRNGKGALVAGAFEDRIALTIPQESGSGGTDCWRLSDYVYANGTVTQTASEIVGENVWFSTRFADFANDTPLLPFDHHELSALVAPRALFVIDNTAYDWLGPWSSYGCSIAARTVYDALGATDHMGYSEVGDHLHCSFPVEAQGAELNAFYQRFLLGTNVDTNIFRTVLTTPFVESDWIDWEVPSLE